MSALRRVSWVGSSGLSHYLAGVTARPGETKALCKAVVGSRPKQWQFFDPHAPKVCATCQDLEVKTP